MSFAISSITFLLLEVVEPPSVTYAVWSLMWSGLRRPEGHTGYRFLRNSTAANGNTEKEEEKTDESNTAAEKG